MVQSVYLQLDGSVGIVTSGRLDIRKPVTFPEGTVVLFLLQFKVFLSVLDDSNIIVENWWNDGMMSRESYSNWRINCGSVSLFTTHAS
jgi:hypothetical protein